MRGKVLLRFLLVMVVLVGSLWSIKKEPMKLGLDLKGGVYAVLEATAEDPNEEIDSETMDSLIEVLDRRINGIGVAESVVQKAGSNRVIIELPGVKDTKEAINMIGKTALLEFKIMDEKGNLGETLLTGGALKKAQVGQGQLGDPQINFELKPEGAVKFAKITRENVGKQLAIVLDGKVQTAPVIKTEISGGSGSISGNYTVEEAQKTAMLLNSGALPIKAEIIETRTVGASLGDESIAASLVAGKVGITLVMVFMLLFYRVPGLIADIALICFGIINFGVINFIGATLTLPGIAGFILSTGMAVDANVIIFERIKEELKFGNTIRGAVKSGFSKGFIAIFDSNLTTLIITTILFVFGTGPVKGFAVTLTVGTLASMFTAITITRVLLDIFVEVFNVKNPKLFGVRGEIDMQIEIVKNSKRWVALSLVFIFISLGALLTKGLNYGIDFSGGNLFQLRFEKPVSLKEINGALDNIGKKIHQFKGNGRKVQISEGNEVLIRIQEITEKEKNEFYEEIKQVGKYEIIKEDKVGASVGKELKMSAVYSLVIGGILIVAYITMRFEFMFAIAAILALVHDIIIAVGGISLLGYEIDTPFIAAVLTILGYSINDTIVVFDRIRETLKKKTDLTFGEVLNKSINQVMVRSLNTSITTLLAVMAILVFGGDSLRTFITTLLIGMVAGTYSSIFIATPLIYLLEKDRDKKVENSRYLDKNDDDEHHEKILV